MHTELSAGGRVLWSGPWQWEVRCDGVLAADRSPWEVVCRASDADVDYLEFRIELAGGLRIERHLMLARRDRFLLLADAVLGDRTGGTAILRRLPLDGGISFRESEGDHRGSPVPRKPTCGDGVAAGAARVWQRRAIGRVVGGTPIRGETVYTAPVATGGPCPADVRSAVVRSRSKPDNAAADVAAAQHRPGDATPAGRRGRRLSHRRRGQQWLVYRSLGGPGNRTLLGHNLTSETLVARFHRNGRVQPIIEVE